MVAEPIIYGVIYGVLLAFHNLALVGCAAAPFYNGNLVRNRAQYGPKLHYKLDKVIEDTIQGTAPYCMVFLAVLFATGIGIPLNYYMFNGEFHELHIVAAIALGLKLLFVFAIAAWGGRIFLTLNPQIKDIFDRFEPGKDPDPDQAKQFFKLRAQRKALCDQCFVFAVLVLISSAFIGFSV